MTPLTVFVIVAATITSHGIVRHVEPGSYPSQEACEAAAKQLVAQYAHAENRVEATCQPFTHHFGAPNAVLPPTNPNKAPSK